MWERKKVVLLHPQNDASVAQLVEHLTLNQGVQGSTPCGSTEKPLKISGFRCFYTPAGSTNCERILINPKQALQTLRLQRFPMRSAR